MDKEKLLICAKCKTPLQIEAKQYTETTGRGLWGEKETYTYYRVGVQCRVCGVEIGLYRLPASECFPEIISYVQKSPSTTYDDAIAVVKRLGFVVNEDGNVEI